jgi:hypothetical protein
MCKVSVWTIYILDYTKMTKSDKLYSVEICNIHYKICQICSLEYKGFHVKILHVCGIHHSLPLDFCFEMFCRNAFWSLGPYDPVFWANQSRTSWSPPAYIVSYQGCTPEYGTVPVAPDRDRFNAILPVRLCWYKRNPMAGPTVSYPGLRRRGPKLFGKCYPSTISPPRVPAVAKPYNIRFC